MFDLFFFIGHYTFHASSFLYKHVHAVHHTAPIIRATDAIRHTFWDGTWDVICSVLALNLTRAHPLSRAIYNIVAISLITEAHSGMNFPWGLHNILPFHIMAGPVVHDTHHRLGRVNFQKYFTYLDFFAGTLKIEPILQEKKAKAL
jgi:sterol desaturase/sphingolipid hydroxylase (fatty acid hydroxylase superfamily)